MHRYDENFNISGPKELKPLRKGLADLFGSVYEAWVFLDLDGDWSLSHSEFKSGILHMRIEGLDFDRIVAYLDR